MEISRKVQTFLHTSRGEERRASIGHFSSKYIDRPLNEASKMSKNESFCEKTYEIGRLLEINRHPPTFPLNKSARHQNSNLEKLFSSHSSPSSWILNAQFALVSPIFFIMRRWFMQIWNIIKCGNWIIILRMFSFSTLCIQTSMD